MTSVYAQRGPVPFPPPVVYLAAFGCGLLVELVAPSPDLPPNLPPPPGLSTLSWDP
jgi:hypothetical protein